MCRAGGRFLGDGVVEGREPVPEVQRQSAVARADRPAPDPYHLAGHHELVQHLRGVGEARGEHVAFQDGSRECGSL